MRWKVDGEDQNAYRCCLCCHVRTGTIFLGIFHLLVHLLVLSLFAVVVLHPELVQHRNDLTATQDVTSFDNNYSAGDSYGYQIMKERKWSSEDKFIGLLLTMGSFFVTVMLVYGAAKGHAGYLMPFFCLQVFDFSVSCLTIVGYFSYMPDLKRCITAQRWLPFKDELMTMDGDWLMLVAILFFVLILSLKAYFLGVVWACYKYLSVGGARSMGRGNARQFSTGVDAEVSDTMLLPPKYEDAVRMANEQPPPPPYYPN